MIVLDENLQDRQVREKIESWYPGQVLSITKLRPQTKINDEAIGSLLRRASEPTFVTINVSDFWQKIECSTAYCVVTMELSNERVPEIAGLLRKVLQMDAFKTKAARMGKVIRWTPTRIECYESNRRVIEVEID